MRHERASACPARAPAATIQRAPTRTGKAVLAGASLLRLVEYHMLAYNIGGRGHGRPQMGERRT
jgi:hypothetical protein